MEILLYFLLGFSLLFNFILAGFLWYFSKKIFSLYSIIDLNTIMNSELRILAQRITDDIRKNDAYYSAIPELKSVLGNLKQIQNVFNEYIKTSLAIKNILDGDKKE